MGDIGHSLFIGRHQELSTFVQLAKTVLINQQLEQPRLLIIRGAPGTGKTKLLQEIIKVGKQQFKIPVYSWDQLNRVNEASLVVLDHHENHSRQEVRDFLLAKRDYPVFVVCVETQENKRWPGSSEITLHNFSLEELSHYLAQIFSFKTVPAPLTQKIFQLTLGNPGQCNQLLQAILKKRNKPILSDELEKEVTEKAQSWDDLEDKTEIEINEEQEGNLELRLKKIFSLFERGSLQQALDQNLKLKEYLIPLKSSKKNNILLFLWTVCDLETRIYLQQQNQKKAKESLDWTCYHLKDFLRENHHILLQLYVENRLAQVQLMNHQLKEASHLFTRTAIDAKIFLNTLFFCFAEDYQNSKNIALLLFYLKVEHWIKEYLSHNDLDEVLFLQRAFDGAYQLCQEKLLENTPPSLQARCYYHLGRISFYQNHVEKAFGHLHQCLEVAKKNYLDRQQMMAYNELGRIFFESTKDFTQTESNWMEALQIAQKNSWAGASGLVASNLGRLYNQLKNYRQAYHFLIYSVNCFEDIGNPTLIDQGHLASSYIELATACREGSFTFSIDSLKRAETIILANPSLTYLHFWILIQYFYYFASQNNFKEAKRYWKGAKKYDQDQKKKDILNEAYQQYSEVLNYG